MRRTRIARALPLRAVGAAALVVVAVAPARVVTGSANAAALAGVNTTLAPDSRSWVDKVTPDLRALQARTTGSIECIVTFRQPKALTASAMSPGNPARLTWIADTGTQLAYDLSAEGLTVLRSYSHLPVLFVRIPAAALPALAGDTRVDAVEPNRVAHAVDTEGNALMHVPDLYSMGYTGTNIGIAILDSGVDYTVPELAPGGTTAAAKTVELWNAIDNNADPMDDYGHGTEVAGIAAGSTHGVAKDARIVAVKVLDSDGSGTDAQILTGINKVLASVTSGNPFNIKVANLSLGGYLEGSGADAVPPQPCDGVLASMSSSFQSLTAAGVLVISAAGNGGCTNGVTWPGCISSSMAIGAVLDASFGSIRFGQSGSPMQCLGDDYCSQTSGPDVIACYSNSGEAMDAWAPSHCATTPQLGGGLDDCFGGTSASAPYASGVAALLSQAMATASPTDIRGALSTTGKLIQDSRNGLIKPRINALAALQELQGTCSTPVAPSTPTPSTVALCGTDQQLTASWAAVTGATSYTVEVDDDPAFGTPSDTLVTSTSFSYTFPGDADTTLHLHVKANNDCGSSPYSPTVQVAYKASCAAASYTYVVSGVAHTPGYAPAFWLTDLAALDVSDQPADLVLDFYGGSSDSSASAHLGVQQQVVWRDLLPVLFGITGNDVGDVIVTSTQPLALLARTYSQTTPGAPTYGQGYPGALVGGALTSNQVGYLPNLRSDAPFYTNLEFVNPGSGDVQIQVQMYTNGGGAIGSPITRTVPAKRRLAILKYQALPSGNSAAFAEVRVLTQGGAVIGYASVIDDLSKDPTTVPMTIP
jgi:hypothetical protein